MNMDWLLWQLADSAFPLGSFAHSGGVEAAVRQGALRAADLPAFVKALLQQSAAGSLPLLFAAHREPAQFAAIDCFCDAFLSNHVANRASRAQGGAMITAAGRIFSTGPLDPLNRLQQQVREERLAAHFPPVFGAIGHALGLAEEQCGRLHLFLVLRGAISSAVRLGVIGPMEGQRIQVELADYAEPLIARARNVPLEDVAQTSPIIDMLQANQDRLYSRLFQS
jgi:urease accessory protein